MLTLETVENRCLDSVVWYSRKVTDLAHDKLFNYSWF